MFYTSDLVTNLEVIISMVITGLNFSPWLFIFLVGGVVFMQMVSMILIGFTAIIKGHSYNNGKILKSFIWFAIYYAICSILSLIVVVIALVISGYGADLLSTNMLPGEVFVILMITAFIIYAVYVAAFYYIANKKFNKGVNVD